MEELLELLLECCPGVDFEDEDRLVDAGILTSLDIVSIVSALNDAYDIDITINDLTPENFNSAQAMLRLVQTLLEQ